MRTVLTWVLVIAILIGGAYLGSPWWTVWNLERAAKAGDAGAVAKVVDFPAVRASLSPQVTVELQHALDREKTKPHSFLDKLTMFVAPLFVPKAVDTLVTPEGVAYMLKTASAPPFINPLQHDHAPPAGEPALNLMQTGYLADDLDQFQAKITNKLAPGRVVTLKMLRRGFLTWKVVGIDLSRTPTTTAGSSAAYAPATAP
jgi:hypothetical protein